MYKFGAAIFKAAPNFLDYGFSWLKQSAKGLKALTKRKPTLWNAGIIACGFAQTTRLRVVIISSKIALHWLLDIQPIGLTRSESVRLLR